MSIKNIITRGFGTGVGVIKDIITRGFSSGLVPVTNPIDWSKLSVQVEQRYSIYIEDKDIIYIGRGG